MSNTNISSNTSPNISTQCVEVKEIVKNVGTSSGGTSSGGGQTFVNVCMKYDKSLDAGKKMIDVFGAALNIFGGAAGVTVDENAFKKSMETLISGIDYNQSELKGNCKDSPCGTTSYNTNNWKWKEEKNGNKVGLKSDYNDKVGVPPRTQVLCFGNLHGEDCKTDVSNIDSNDKLLSEWLIAAKIEGQNLKTNYGKNNNDKSKLCKALGYSYADIGDLIKGTSIWENKWTKLLEENLKQMFGRIFEGQYKNNTNSANSSSNVRYESLDQLREVWWNTNKEYIWHALYKGAKLDSSTNTCPGIDKDIPPTTDHIPQFLRFAHEWVEQFCEKRKQKADEVVNACQKYHETHSVDKNSGSSTSGAPGKKCDENNGNNDKDCKECNTKCQACKEACDAYKNFVSSTGGGGTTNDWRKQWENMDKKYRDLMDEARKQLEEQSKTSQTSSSGATGGNQCSGNNLCVKSDINSIYICVYITTMYEYYH
uniref:EMP1-like protein n=1 Tax=Plasmodium gaboni TaxID=647221 RepID=A0A0P0HMW4_9APIC|nr:EMP1-like protein [Plasmodium gaboni]